MTNKKKINEIKTKLNNKDDPTLIKKLIENPYEYAKNAPLTELVSILEKLSHNYYNIGESLVSDTVYDLLRSTLEERDPGNEFLSKIGAPISKDQVNLPYPMPSLDKIKPDTQLLEKWKNKFKGPYVLSDKLDGVSGLFYKDKNVFKLYTRGETTTGQDITFLIPYILQGKLSPAQINKIPSGTAIRGEIIMSKKNFEKIKDQYKNPRNTIAGLVNSKHFSIEVAKLTDFIAYSITYPILDSILQMEKLKEWGLPLVTYKVENDLTNDMLSKYLQMRRASADYEVDGIVVSDSSKAYNIEEKNPDYAFAFKMVLTDQVAEVTVLDIEWNITKHGYIKPVVKIEPVNLVGVTIKNVTAFNAKYVVDNKLGPGSIIKIVRSGDVIPHILEVLKPSASGNPKMPTIPYKWNDSGIDIIVQDIHGSAKDAIAIKQITSFFKVMGVKNISEGIVTKFVEHGYDSIEKILKADSEKDKLGKIDGFGDKILTKIYNNIDIAFKASTLEILMASSNVFGRGFGVRRLKVITNAYPNIMKEKWDKKILREKIMELNGFDDITASQFADNFEDFKKFYVRLEKIDTIDISHIKNIKLDNKIKTNTNTSKSSLFEGQKIVFTGFRDKELENFITNNGGSVSTTVSGNTTLLIYTENEKDVSTKYNKAKSLNIDMITKEEFMKKYK